PFELTKAVSTPPRTEASQDKNSIAPSASGRAATGPNAQISTQGEQALDFSQSIPFELTKAVSTSPRTEASQDKNSIARSASGRAATGPNAQISTQGQQARDFSQSIPFELTKAIPTSPRTEASQDINSIAPSASGHAATGPNAQISAQGQRARDFSQSLPSELTKTVSTSPRTEASQDKNSIAPSAS